MEALQQSTSGTDWWRTEVLLFSGRLAARRRVRSRFFGRVTDWVEFFTSLRQMDSLEHCSNANSRIPLCTPRMKAPAQSSGR